LQNYCPKSKPKYSSRSRNDH